MESGVKRRQVWGHNCLQKDDSSAKWRSMESLTFLVTNAWLLPTLWFRKLLYLRIEWKMWLPLGAFVEIGHCSCTEQISTRLCSYLRAQWIRNSNFAINAILNRKLVTHKMRVFSYVIGRQMIHAQVIRYHWLTRSSPLNLYRAAKELFKLWCFLMDDQSRYSQ